MENIKTDEIIAAVRACGAIILNAERTSGMTEEKSGKANFVTVYDKLVQQTIKAKLFEIMPEAVFVGEEEDVHAAIDSGYAFIVDPIDGTTNFIKDYRHSAVSCALLKDGSPVFGAIYNPYLDEMFTAVRGEGAFLNGSPIHVSDEPLSNGIVLVGTSPYYEELSEKTFRMAFDYFRKALDIRRSGSAALDLCAVASGRAEVFCELILSPWDYAAGSLIVGEAGGRVTTVEGEKLRFDAPCSLLASNGCV